MTPPSRMFVEIVSERKEAHHGLASCTVGRGAAANRQRGTVLASQPANPGKDARPLVVAQRDQAPGRGQDRRCKSSEFRAGWPQGIAPLGLPQIRKCEAKNSSRHISSIHLPSAYNRVFGTSPVGRVVPGPSPEGSTRRVIMRRSRATAVPPRAQSVEPVLWFRASSG